MPSTQQMFNPALENAETLKAVVVEREEELQSVLKRLGTEDVTGTSRSFMVVGPRGMGKTHFLLLVYYNIKEKEDLKKKYISLKFSEEEYSIDSLAFFFLRLLEELKKECPEEEATIEEFLERTEEFDNKDLVKEADRFLEELFRKHKVKIVLCVDNLDEIFKAISSEETGLKHLRSILQTKDYLLLMGAAPTFFKEIKNHEEPFYNFFEVIRLSPLSQDGVEELITKLAKQEGRSDILENLDELRPKIKTIIHFTGGVPRLVRMLFYVIVNSEIGNVADYLGKLLDELTPYYQARMAQLSPQQQKVIDTMALMEGPATPTEIARKARMNRAVVNVQMRKLADSGFVQLIQQRKRKWRRYGITERMFRIWREMRREKGKRRIGYLGEFLKAFYSEEDLKRHIEHLGKREMAIPKLIEEYEFLRPITPENLLPEIYLSLIENYLEKNDLQKSQDLVGISKELFKEIKISKEIEERLFQLELKAFKKAGRIAEDYSAARYKTQSLAALAKAFLLQQKEKYGEALVEFERSLNRDSTNSFAFFGKITLLFQLEKYEQIVSEFESFFEEKTPPSVVAHMKACALCGLGQYDEAIEECENILKQDPWNLKAQEWKAIALFESEKYKKAIPEFDKVIEVEPENRDALVFKALSLFHIENYKKSIEGFSKVLEITPLNEDALYFKALCHHNLGAYHDSLVEFDKVLNQNFRNDFAHYWKAQSLCFLNRFQEAADELRKAFDIKPRKETLFDIGICHIFSGQVNNFLDWFHGLEEEDKSLSVIFAEREFYQKERWTSILDFLEATKRTKDPTSGFLKFWKELQYFVLQEIVFSSELDLEEKNFGTAKETLSFIFKYNNICPLRTLTKPFTTYFISILRLNVPQAKEIFELFKNELGEEFTRTFRPLEKAIEFLETKDEEVLEKLFSEEREVVEELIKKVRNTEP